jgi:predicted outer membrane repeat protein
VTNYGIFKLSNGAIFGNTASRYGGGVVNYFGIILANGVYNYGGNISLSGGEISGNTAEYGGGIYSTDGSVSIFGGTVSSNTATRNGGGVYNDFSIDASGKLIYSSCNFKMSGGKILGNTATNSGSGVGVSHFEGLERVFISEGVIFSDNRASVAYNRSTTHDTLYNSQISSKVTWTAPFTQGYNNYDISYTITTQDTTTNNEITDR